MNARLLITIKSRGYKKVNVYKHKIFIHFKLRLSEYLPTLSYGVKEVCVRFAIEEMMSEFLKLFLFIASVIAFLRNISLRKRRSHTDLRL